MALDIPVDITQPHLFSRHFAVTRADKASASYVKSNNVSLQDLVKMDTRNRELRGKCDLNKQRRFVHEQNNCAILML